MAPAGGGREKAEPCGQVGCPSLSPTQSLDTSSYPGAPVSNLLWLQKELLGQTPRAHTCLRIQCQPLYPVGVQLI